jgi:hypothetical protein
MSDASLTSERIPSPLANGPELASDPAAARTWSDWLAAGFEVFEERLFHLSDWFNPILVKETRQALRSWQFSLTFILLLVACWVVTIGGIALIGPSVYYAAGGGVLLRAYFFVLSLPLLVVVPFAAFRSLAAEREDNTYDLVSITALGPRQIISGKLASAVVQMIVYFSAITPCLAFTYLLRGVDVPTIAMLLVYTFFASLGLSMLGLLLATLSEQRYGQLIMSVAFIALLLLGFYFAQIIAWEMVDIGYSFLGDREFWIAHLFSGTFYATTFALFFLAAAAMITFATENRSTALRIVMLIQQASMVGWVAYAWIESSFDLGPILVLAVLGGAYWFVMGSLLDGEQTEMSRRVRRSLPQSFLGRMLFTWLNPGPASGFMFAVANLTTVLVICLWGTFYSADASHSSGNQMVVMPSIAPTVLFLSVGWSYVVAYLGLGRLVVMGLRKFTEVTMFASVLLHLLLVLAGSGIPTTMQWMSIELQNEPYSYLQATNPFWTLTYLIDFDPAPEAIVLMVVIPAAAFCLLLLNLPSVVREMQLGRVAVPKRVAEDELELHPPPETLPQNPWDEPERPNSSRAT